MLPQNKELEKRHKKFHQKVFNIPVQRAGIREIPTTQVLSTVNTAPVQSTSTGKSFIEVNMKQTSTPISNLDALILASKNLPNTSYNSPYQDKLVTEDKTKQKQPNTTSTKLVNNIKLSKKALNLYYKLIPMFPGVDPNYIKQLCKNRIEVDTLEEPQTSYILQELIDQLLKYGQAYPHIKRTEPPPKPIIFDVNEQYTSLLEIFPDADPVYLRDIAEKVYNDPEKKAQFVQSKLENPDYPTKQQYLAKKKLTEQQKQYTTDFQVQQFLEIFPDPVAHFENANRKCQFNRHAFDFLKHHFNKIRVIINS